MVDLIDRPQRSASPGLVTVFFHAAAANQGFLQTTGGCQKFFGAVTRVALISNWLARPDIPVIEGFEGFKDGAWTVHTEMIDRFDAYLRFLLDSYTINSDVLGLCSRFGPLALGKVVRLY